MVHENIFTEPLRKRRSLDLCCYNTLIVSDSGEGGNFVMKTDIMDVLQNTKDDVIVLDAYGEYSAETSIPEVNKITFSPKGCFIDPLYFSIQVPRHDYCDDPVARFSDLMIAMMKSMELIPSTLHASSAYRAVYSAIKRICEAENKSTPDFLTELAKENDDQTKLFVHWMNQFDFFSNAPIDLSSRCVIVCLDTFDRNCKTAVTMMMLNHLLSAIHEKYRQTGKYTWLYIPHLDALLEKDTDGFIPQIFRRLRTHAGIFVGSAEKGSFSSKTSRDICNLCNCVYIMNPSKKAHEWLDALDIVPESVGLMDNMVYVLGGETGFIPPRDMKEDIPEDVPEEETVLPSSEQNLNYLERVIYNMLFKHRKRAD